MERYVETDCGYRTPCWIWALSKNNRGYGRVRVAGAERLAHVHFWTERFGPVPEGRELDHLCRIPACVNPSHLEPVTHAENMQRGASARFTPATVLMMRWASLTTSLSYADLGRIVGTDRSTARKMVVGLRWPV